MPLIRPVPCIILLYTATIQLDNTIIK
uniref:Uncharacterized protein n=1 Tax=Anguilla anguilla TaxID=7936 RepID=A0A0E9RDR0_ANGAN